MRLAVRFAGGATAFGFTEATFGHVVDELAIAAARVEICGTDQPVLPAHPWPRTARPHFMRRAPP